MSKHRRRQEEEQQSHAIDTKDEAEYPFLMRNIDDLYCQTITFDCAIKKLCVPCAYKVGLFDVALDQDFCRRVPNQRPEQCPRIAAATATTVATASNHPTGTTNRRKKRRRRQYHDDTPPQDPTTAVEPTTMGFRPGMCVLAVGDGDLSFSLAIAKQIMTSKRKSETEKNKGALYATSYESKETLLRVYPAFQETHRALLALGVSVLFEIDATKLCRYFDEIRFDCIVWNFPCTAVPMGQDGQNQAMEDNKALLRKFVREAVSLLHRPHGEIYICHKTKPPFDQWDLPKVMTQQEEGGGGGEECDALSYKGRIVLDRATLIPYVPRKALDRKSFPCHDACFYIFGFDDENNEDSSKRRSGAIHNAGVEPVTPAMIGKIRKALLCRPSKKRHRHET